MTREEAIAKLKNFADHCYPNEEFLIAIQALEQEPKTEKVIKMRDATPEERELIDKYIKSISKPTGVNFWSLEQEPSGDAVSRQAVIDCFKKWQPYMATRLHEFEKELFELSSAKPQEPKILETIDFAIDVSNGDTNYFVGFRNGLRYAKSLIDGEEPQFESCAEQEPKTGHWIEEDVFDGDIAYRCSECNELFWLEDGTPKDNGYNFCPKCGANLVEPQERSEE